jgi:hypothetical protein
MENIVITALTAGRANGRAGDDVPVPPLGTEEVEATPAGREEPAPDTVDAVGVSEPLLPRDRLNDTLALPTFGAVGASTIVPGKGCPEDLAVCCRHLALFCTARILTKPEASEPEDASQTFDCTPISVGVLKDG